MKHLKEKLEIIKKTIELERQRKIIDFREEPTFYKYCILTSQFHHKCKDIPYIREICDTMESFIDNELLNDLGKPYFGLIITLPPGHAKTRTAQLLDSYIFFNKNRRAKLANFSYAMANAKNSCVSVRLDIKKETADEPHLFTPRELFGFGLDFRKDLNTKTEWSLEGQPLLSYWVGAPKTQNTGKRSNLNKYDDIVKNSKEALDEDYLDFLYETFFLNDTLTRLEDRTKDSKDKVLILQTQWAENDLIGKLSKPEYKNRYKIIKYPALLNFDDVYSKDAEPQMLNELIYDFETFDLERIEAEKNTISKSIFYCLTQQKIVALQNSLYSFTKNNFYPSFPETINYKIVASFDPAKGGKDGNALWIARQYTNQKTRKKELYVLDAYVKSGDSKLINLEVAELLKKYSVQEIIVEKNSGGDKDIIMLKDSLKAVNYNLKIIPFFQKNNKEKRILSNAGYIKEDVFFPLFFNKTDIYKHLKNFKTIFKYNKEDDIEDSLTMLYEKYGNLQKSNGTSTNTLSMLSRL